MNHFLKTLKYLLVAALFTGCSMNRDTQSSSIDKKSITGSWEKTIHDERYIFSFKESADGSFLGSMTIYRKGNAAGEIPVYEIVFEESTLSMVTNREKQILFKGVLDTVDQVIRGKLFYTNGSTYPFDLKRTAYLNSEKRKHPDKPVQTMYKTIDRLPPVRQSGQQEIHRLITHQVGRVSGEHTGRNDALAVITRRQGEIYPAYPERSTALMLAFLADPVTKKISDTWRNLIRDAISTEQKVAAINQWTTQNMAYTQAHPDFSAFPGKDPWGTFEDGQQPVFKKLIPPEMEAMQTHTGKISGKCFTLVNLIMSSFMQLGVPPDDILVLITKSGDARHAMGLVKYEGKVLLVNLMMVGILENYLQKDFGTYEILGLYNLYFALKVNLHITRSDLQTIIHLPDPELVNAILGYFNLVPQRVDLGPFVPASGDHITGMVFDKTRDNRIFELARYAYQSLNVPHPEYYLEASSLSSIPKDLVKSLRSADAVFHWIESHIRYGSIFRESGERIMTADQVLVFQQGSMKDQAILACTLLKHMGIESEIEISADNAYIKLPEKLYDLKNHTYTGNHVEKTILALHSGD